MQSAKQNKLRFIVFTFDRIWNKMHPDFWITNSNAPWKNIINTETYTFIADPVDM